MVTDPKVPGDYPLVRLPGDERWHRGYKWAELLYERWPDECAWDFASAVSENVFESDPLWNTLHSGVASLKCEQEGENDGEHWVWLASFGDGTTWRITGWCDYTGWDCQSGIDAEQVTA